MPPATTVDLTLADSKSGPTSALLACHWPWACCTAALISAGVLVGRWRADGCACHRAGTPISTIQSPPSILETQGRGLGPAGLLARAHLQFVEVGKIGGAGHLGFAIGCRLVPEVGPRFDPLCAAQQLQRERFPHLLAAGSAAERGHLRAVDRHVDHQLAAAVRVEGELLVLVDAAGGGDGRRAEEKGKGRTVS